MLWVKVLFLPRNAEFLQKYADISKIKVALVLKGIFSVTTYVCIFTCQLGLSKVLMYEFHYDYNKNKYDNKSKLLFTDTDSLMYAIKAKIYMKLLAVIKKEIFEFSNYSTKWKYCDNSNKLVTWKMKGETGGVVVEEFVELKPKIYSFLVDNNGHKK